jgi:hypothetical protein
LIGSGETSSLLISADYEVTILNLGTRDPKRIGWIKLAQHQCVALPPDKLFDQH